MRSLWLSVLLAACAGRAAPASSTTASPPPEAPSPSPGAPPSSSPAALPSPPPEASLDTASGGMPISSIPEPPIETTDQPVVPAATSRIKQHPLPKGNHAVLFAGNTYPAEALRLRIEGTIRVRLLVDADGKVRSTVLLNHLGHGLDELARDRAQRIEFEPARDLDDHPIASLVIWTFKFQIPHDDAP